LAYSCISVNADDRPSALNAFFRVKEISKRVKVIVRKRKRNNQYQILLISDMINKTIWSPENEEYFVYTFS